MSSRLRIVVGVVISAFFIYWATRQVSDVGAVGRALAGANYWYMIPGLAIYFVGVGIRAWRWRFLLKPVRSVGAGALFPIVVIGYTLNDILPARSGEFARAYLVGSKDRVPRLAALGSIVVERLFDGLAMLLFIGAVSLFTPLDASIAGLFRVGGALFLALFVIFIVVASSRKRTLALIKRLEDLLPALLRGRIESIADRFLHGFTALQSPPLMTAILGLSIAAWLCEATMYYLVALGFNLGLGFPAYVLTTAVANLVAMVPGAPGYIGTFDFGARESLALFGASPNLALGYIAALHVALLVPITLLGFVFLWRFNLSLRTIEEHAEEEARLPTDSDEDADQWPADAERAGDSEHDDRHVGTRR